jgi:hypothetical protein
MTFPAKLVVSFMADPTVSLAEPTTSSIGSHDRTVRGEQRMVITRARRKREEIEGYLENVCMVSDRYSLI